MLNDIELAILANKLQAPTIVSDILDRKEGFTEDVKYSLHELISDLQPDSALLAIALSALKISNIYRTASSSMDVMGIEAKKIIEDYGDVWLKNANKTPVEDDIIYETLIHTAEDLEALAELLNLNCSFLRAKDSDAATVCDVLHIQANSHAMIADAFLNAADQMVANGAITTPTATQKNYTNNVVPFPGLRY